MIAQDKKIKRGKLTFILARAIRKAVIEAKAIMIAASVSFPTGRR